MSISLSVSHEREGGRLKISKRERERVVVTEKGISGFFGHGLRPWKASSVISVILPELHFITPCSGDAYNHLASSCR